VIYLILNQVVINDFIDLFDFPNFSNLIDFPNDNELNYIMIDLIRY